MPCKPCWALQLSRRCWIESSWPVEGWSVCSGVGIQRGQQEPLSMTLVKPSKCCLACQMPWVIEGCRKARRYVRYSTLSCCLVGCGHLWCRARHEIRVQTFWRLCVRHTILKASSRGRPISGLVFAPGSICTRVHRRALHAALL